MKDSITRLCEIDINNKFGMYAFMVSKYDTDTQEF